MIIPLSPSHCREAFSAIFREKFADGGSAMLRFSNPDSSKFPQEEEEEEKATRIGYASCWRKALVEE